MKKFVAVLLTLTLLLGTGTAAMAKPSFKTTTTTTTLPESSTYEFSYTLPDYVVTEKDATVGVTLKTAVLGEEGYNDAYVTFSATGPGSVNLAKDSTNTYVNQGTLEDFDLSAQYKATTNWTMNFTDDGTYNVTFKLFDAADNELAKKTQEIKVTDGVFLYTLPEKIYEDSEITAQVKFLTQQDYDDIHLSFAKISGAGDVVFEAKDADDNEYSFTNSGDLKPATFDIEGPYNETTACQLTFSQDGTYQIAFKLMDEDNDVLLQSSQKVIVKNVAIDDEDDDEDEDEDKHGKGKTHGLVNAVRNHLKFKKNGKSPSESQSLNRLMEHLQDRGLSEDLLNNLKEAIDELEEAIAEMEKAIAAQDSDADDYRALAKMKFLKGKKYETYIDGKKVNYADAEPILEKNRTLVPFRKLAEILGAEVSWNAEKKEITLTKEDKTVVLTIDKKTAIVDGKTVALDSPAKIYKNRTLVPLRFLAEALDTTVDFYPEGSLICIKKNHK